MSQLNSYKEQEAFGGWTRVDMLLSIYKLAIESLTEAERLLGCEDKAEDYAFHYLKAQKAILAIHSGLRPDEHEVAFNVARLLHFVLECVEDDNFTDAIKVLKSLHDGFKAIQAEANQLESDGNIAAIETAAPYIVSA